MKNNVRHKRVITVETVVSIIIFAVILILFIGGLSDAAGNSVAEGARIAKISLMRAAASCYAFEGAYPSDYQYLVDNYGINVDTDKYIVHYEAISSNLMPNIKILIK
ncbi:MAG: hypothetical protein FWF15_00290 [Oscillospiraceae bacterium]|nr:hypothetical protein [Oscillospiraceae bacterium]